MPAISAEQCTYKTIKIPAELNHAYFFNARVQLVTMVVRTLEAELGVGVMVAEEPLISAALGAALLQNSEVQTHNRHS